MRHCGAITSLATPFLLQGDIGAISVVAVVAISTTIFGIKESTTLMTLGHFSQKSS